MKDVLTTGEVAKLCKVAPRTVAKWFDNEGLKGFRIPGGKDRRVPVQSLREFLVRHDMPTEELDRDIYWTVLVLEVPPSVLEELRRRLPPTEGWKIVAGKLGFEAGIIAAKCRPDLITTPLEGEKLNGFVTRIMSETAAAREARDASTPDSS